MKQSQILSEKCELLASSSHEQSNVLSRNRCISTPNITSESVHALMLGQPPLVNFTSASLKQKQPLKSEIKSRKKAVRRTKNQLHKINPRLVHFI